MKCSCADVCVNGYWWDELFNLLFIICPMIISLLTHLLAALLAWVVRGLTPPSPHSTKLSLTKQLSFTYSRPEDGNKKRKNKKAKRKQKKQQLEVLNCEEEEPQDEPHPDESDKEDSERDQQSIKIQQPQGKAPQPKYNNPPTQLEMPSQQQPNQQEQVPHLQDQQQTRKAKVAEEIQLIRNYFMQELEDVVPYNGNYGHYRLTLEGTNKSIQLEWKYHSEYPQRMVEVSISREQLNPLEQETLNRILEENMERAKRSEDHRYLLNLATCIYQDMMIAINEDHEEEKSEVELPLMRSHTDLQFDLKMAHTTPEEIKAKKEIYGKILDEIFYLHDMIEKPDASAMKIAQDEPMQLKHTNTRGRYESEFEELELIGEGGFGKVYKVRHKLDGNIYAIKKAVVNFDDLNDRKMLKEVALLSKLNHPNIVRYYQSWLEDTHSIQELKQDMSFSEREHSKIQELNNIYAKWKNDRSDIRFGGSSNSSEYEGSLVENSGIVFEYGEEDDGGIVFEDEEMSVSGSSSIDYAGQHGKNESESSLMDEFKGFPFKILYIAMELCSGINLREFINHHFDQEEHKIQILRGILEGLAYIHSKKIIHRDLKPANIFLTDQNKVKIGDFGLATSEERSVSISLESDESDFLGDKTKAVGTGFYRAPEQLKTQKYDEKVDIYSLGIIMFELFYRFKTTMERMETLKELTYSHKLPKQFQSGADILENIQICLQQNPEKRPSASKLLEGFRNKYFTQLVSCIANPKHFQFSELLNHLFAINNDHGTILMKRDAYKTYITDKIMKIYSIHRATHFPTLPLISIQDFHSLNGQKIKIDRKGKLLLLTERGVILQYSSNCLKGWLIYVRDAMRKKKGLNLEGRQEAVRRFTFQKVINWEQNPRNNEADFQFTERMVTAFDLAYKLQDGFNAFYFCEVLKVSESIVVTLPLTQKHPPIYISHSQLFALLAVRYGVSSDLLYSVLLSMKEDEFCALSNAKRIGYLEQRNLPNHISKKLAALVDFTFEAGTELLESVAADRDSPLYHQIASQIAQVEATSKRILNNSLKWRLGIPSANSSGFFWSVGTVKGLTSVEEYPPHQEQLCNYHIETSLDQGMLEADVSLWCIGEYLEEDMQKMILECWKNGLTTQWYEWQVGEKEDCCRHNIILRRKNERVQVMLRHKDLKDHMERESSFISIEQFNMEVIKQMSTLSNHNFYH